MVVVLGAGNGGVAISTYLEQKGIETILWNRTEERLNPIRKNNNIIKVRSVNDNEYSDVKITEITTDLQCALSKGKYVFIVTPGNAHKDIARVSAPFLTKEHVIILMPGRTYGSIVFSEEINRQRGFYPKCIEAQTILHACRINGNVLGVHGLKTKVLYSSFDKIDDREKNYLKDIIPEFEYDEDYFKITLNNIGALLHPIPTILNAARIESGSSFKYYSEGLTPTVTEYIQKVDEERKSICDAVGCQYISLIEWLNKEYGSNSDSIYNCIKEIEAYKNINAPNTLNHRYIYDDICTGLVPIYNTGKAYGIEAKTIKTFIEFASILMKYDFMKFGREFNKEMLIK